MVRKEHIKITAAALTKRAGEVGLILCDTELIGFQARINQNSISFYLHKKISGRIVERKIAQYPGLSPDDARKKAMRLISDALDNKIVATRSRVSPTVGDCIDLYVQSVKCKEHAISTLKYWDPFRRKKVVDFTRQDAMLIVGRLKDHPCTANNAMKYLSSGINKMSIEIGEELPNPFRLIKQYRTEPRKRFLSEEEAPALIQEFRRLCDDPVYSVQAYALLLMIFTGQRKSNVLKINLSEINNGIWVIPATKVKGSKHEIVVPLNSFAMDIINLRKPFAVNGYLFVQSGQTEPLKNIRKTFIKACANLGIEDCRPHDLRRTMGSWMLMNGTPIEVVSRTLGHTSIQVTERVYAHLLPGKISDATESAIAAMFKGKV